MQLNEQQTKWAQETLERVSHKLEKVSERSKDKIPYTTVNGIHDDWSGGDKIGWWTNGFWGGMMWQMYALTGKEFYKEIAENNEKKLDADLMDYDKLDHDNGFKWLPTAVANYRMTGNKASRNRGLLAASNLAGRYNSAGRFIRAWNNWDLENDRTGWAIIDCMMNLPLLYWARSLRIPGLRRLPQAMPTRPETAL
jgi:unsaturated chondroitin disaccharide hydrolase